MAKKHQQSLRNPADVAPVPATGLAANPDAPSEAAPPERASEADRNDSRERIATRAYALYLERGGEHGRATEDWLAAERELSQQNGGSSYSSNDR